MVTTAPIIRNSLLRQTMHWQQAAMRLRDADKLVNAFGWAGVDHTIAKQLRFFIEQTCLTIINQCNTLRFKINKANDELELMHLKTAVIALRELYLSTETSVHFYTDALNTRTTAHIASIMRACDIICKRSMDEVLVPLGKHSPKVLTYLDKGVGASILKANLRLWNGSNSPFAAVKVTYHNLFRPTAIVHETGHQVAHILNWTHEMAAVFSNAAGVDAKVRLAFANWASEIVADYFAFAHTGYASVSALRDVVSSWPEMVFNYHPNDPHPISYIRVMLAIEWCRQRYGNGHWDELQQSFEYEYDINIAVSASVPFVKACLAAVPQMARLCLEYPFRAFGGRPLSAIISPDRVSPGALKELQRVAGDALFTSHVWINKEPIRTLALNSYHIAAEPENERYYLRQEEWMKRLGYSVELN